MKYMYNTQKTTTYILLSLIFLLHATRPHMIWHCVSLDPLSLVWLKHKSCICRAFKALRNSASNCVISLAPVKARFRTTFEICSSCRRSITGSGKTTKWCCFYVRCLSTLTSFHSSTSRWVFNWQGNHIEVFRKLRILVINLQNLHYLLSALANELGHQLS